MSNIIYYVYRADDSVLLSDAEHNFTVIFCRALEKNETKYKIFDIDKNQYVMEGENLVICQKRSYQK